MIWNRVPSSAGRCKHNIKREPNRKHANDGDASTLPTLGLHMIYREHNKATKHDHTTQTVVTRNKVCKARCTPRPRLVSLPHSLSPHRLPKSSFFGSALRCFDVSLATWSTIISEVAIPCRVAAPTGSEHAHPPGSAATGLSRKKELAGLISLRPAKQTTTTPRAHYVFVKIYLSIPYFQSTHFSQSHRASQDPPGNSRSGCGSCRTVFTGINGVAPNSASARAGPRPSRNPI
jgi:hypothetical protein